MNVEGETDVVVVGGGVVGAGLGAGAGASGGGGVDPADPPPPQAASRASGDSIDERTSKVLKENDDFMQATPQAALQQARVSLRPL